MNSITLILTEDCNQSCSYCYQVRSKKHMSRETAYRAIDFMKTHLGGEPAVKFYGGEPLLEYLLIKDIIRYCRHTFSDENINPKFSLTTNGSLLTSDHINELASEKVKIYLSIDGLKQAHQFAREGFDHLMGVFNLIQTHPDMELHTLSVITPQNVRYLAESFHFLLSFEPATITFNIQYDQEWSGKDIELLALQYETISTILLLNAETGTRISMEGLSGKSDLQIKALNECSAGEDNLVVGPDGSLHGCVMLTPNCREAIKNNTVYHFKDLNIGNILTSTEKDIIDNMQQLTNNKKLSGQFFRYSDSGPCARCKHIMNCSICPAVSMIHSQDPLYIPEWICQIKEAVYGSRISVKP